MWINISPGSCLVSPSVMMCSDNLNYVNCYVPPAQAETAELEDLEPPLEREKPHAQRGLRLSPFRGMIEKSPLRRRPFP